MLLITDLTITTSRHLLAAVLIISVERSLIHGGIPAKTNLMTNIPAVFHLQKRREQRRDILSAPIIYNFLKHWQ